MLMYDLTCSLAETGNKQVMMAGQENCFWG